MNLPRDGKTSDALIRAAALNMYRHKQPHGRPPPPALLREPLLPQPRDPHGRLKSMTTAHPVCT